jgi:amidohydrolase
LDQIIRTLRRELHQHPELSGQEAATAQRIRTFIQAHHPTAFLDRLGGHGLAAVYTYPAPGPTVVIRCELDALPIAETNTFAHRSASPGVSHKCGHDGHMAIVAGLVGWLRDHAPALTGRVVLLFQPAEETGQGAAAVLADPRFRELQPDFIFALHNIPGVPLGTIIALRQHFSAAVQSLAIDLTGKEAHAAEPENGINPAAAMALILQEFEQLNVPDPQQPNFALLTPVHLQLGQLAYGISPGAGELHFTFRTWDEAVLDQLKTQALDIIARVCRTHGLQWRTTWLEYFPATQNDPAANQLIVAAAKSLGFPVQEQALPFRFGEDFGWYSQSYRAAMFGVGAGTTTPALHHADYDFPDELIAIGVAMFGRIVVGCGAGE